MSKQVRQADRLGGCVRHVVVGALGGSCDILESRKIMRQRRGTGPA